MKNTKNQILKPLIRLAKTTKGIFDYNLRCNGEEIHKPIPSARRTRRSSDRMNLVHGL